MSTFGSSELWTSVSYHSPYPKRKMKHKFWNIFSFMSNKKLKALKALIPTGQYHRKLCVGRLETKRMGSLERRVREASHMQMMKDWSAVEERGRGTEVMISEERRKQGAHCGLTSKCHCSMLAPIDTIGLSPLEKVELMSKDVNWLKNFWQRILSAGNTALLISSMLQ